MLMLLGSWAPTGSCEIMLRIMPLILPENAWKRLILPAASAWFVRWERLKVPDAQKPENQET